MNKLFLTLCAFSLLTAFFLTCANGNSRFSSEFFIPAFILEEQEPSDEMRIIVNQFFQWKSKNTDVTQFRETTSIPSCFKETTDYEVYYSLPDGHVTDSLRYGFFRSKSCYFVIQAGGLTDDYTIFIPAGSETGAGQEIINPDP